MRETETLYSAPGKEGRIGDRGSERGRTVSGTTPLSPPLPLTPSHSSLSLSPLLPPPSLLTPRDAHSLGIWGRTHSSLRECVFVYVDL